jgi:hypothetical protein
MARGVTVRSFWHGGELPPHCWLCLQSFIDLGHRFVLYSYEETRAPPGVAVRDAREIVPQSRIFFYKDGPGAGSVAAFANLFRYRLLFSKGGWWVDADVLCLSPDLPTEESAFAWQAEGSIGNAVLRFPKGSPVLAKLCFELEKTISVKGDALRWGEIGPDLMTRLIKDDGLDNHALPPRAFYPLHWSEFELLLQPDKTGYVLRRTRGSLLLHLWHEMFRRANLASLSPPPSGSYLAMMMARHRVRAVPQSRHGGSRQLSANSAP